MNRIATRILPQFIIVFLISFFLRTAESAETFSFVQDNSLPLVHFSIILPGGCAHDPRQQLGRAYMAGQMLLRGTKKLSKLDLLQTFDRLGASVELEVQGENTLLRASVLSKNLGKLLQVLEKILLEPAFSDKEFRKLKKETVGLLLSERSQDAKLTRRHFQHFLFGSHPYSHPLHGTERGVSRTSVKNLKDFYQAQIASHDLAFFGSGDCQPKFLETWWNSFLRMRPTSTGSGSQPQMELADLPAPAPVPTNKLLLVDKPGASQSHVFIGTLAPRPENKDYYPIILANEAFGGHSFNSTLMQEVREKRGWSYGAYSFFAYARQPQAFSMYFFPKTKDTVPAIKLSLELFKNYLATGIPKDQFEFAKRSLVKSAPFQFDSPKKRLENRIQQFLYRFPEGYFEKFEENIASVGQDQIKPSLKDFFANQGLTITVLGNGKELQKELDTLRQEFPEMVKHKLNEDLGGD